MFGNDLYEAFHGYSNILFLFFTVKVKMQKLFRGEPGIEPAWRLNEMGTDSTLQNSTSALRIVLVRANESTIGYFIPFFPKSVVLA